MPVARVISKGRVTIPVEIRKALGIERGDGLAFETSADGTARLRVVKRSRLTDLYGALPATRPFPGEETVREAVGLALATD